MADEFEKLREEIACAIYRAKRNRLRRGLGDIEVTDEVADHEKFGVFWTDAVEAAGAALTHPAIADVLRMKPIQTMPVHD